MKQVVSRVSVRALVEPHYPKTGRARRRPYTLASMLRVPFLHQWCALSEPAMEGEPIDDEALYGPEKNSHDAVGVPMDLVPQGRGRQHLANLLGVADHKILPKTCSLPSTELSPRSGACA